MGSLLPYFFLSLKASILGRQSRESISRPLSSNISLPADYLSRPRCQIYNLFCFVFNRTLKFVLCDTKSVFRVNRPLARNYLNIWLVKWLPSTLMGNLDVEHVNWIPFMPLLSPPGPCTGKEWHLCSTPYQKPEEHAIVLEWKTIS
jgi:hypothetical protein